MPGGTTEAPDFKYREKGNFVGASYSLDFDARGQLGLSLAYADLPATLTRTTLRSGDAGSTTGTTTGTGHSIRLTGLLAPGVDFIIGLPRRIFTLRTRRHSLFSYPPQHGLDIH